MIRIGIVGSGRVAYHLTKGFLNSSLHKDIRLEGVYARDKVTLSTFLPSAFIINDLEDLKNADVLLIAVSDEAINEVSFLIPFTDKIIAHTSGSTPMEVLSKHDRRGVFYPLQTFSKEKNVVWNEIPIAIEATSVTDEAILQKIASALSGNVLRLNSEQRVALHASAVFVANFVNHMFVLGHEICKKNNISFELLKPLIKETAQKVITLSPKEAQTGPAVRFDHQTIERHKTLLHSFPEGLYLYDVITKSIQNVHKNNISFSQK